jgi:hypothetical protein
MEDALSKVTASLEDFVKLGLVKKEWSEQKHDWEYSSNLSQWKRNDENVAQKNLA